MGKSAPSPPPAPDPAATAAAQTASNKETAIANANLNRNDTVTPWYTQSWTKPQKQVQATDADGALMFNKDGSPIYKTGADGKPVYQYNADGTPVYETNADGTPIYRQQITLSADQQKLLDQSTQQGIAKNELANKYITGAFSKMANTPLDMSNVPKLQSQVTAGKMQTEIEPTAGQIQYSFDESGVPKMPTLDREAQLQQQEATFGRMSPQLEIQRKALENKLVNQGVMQGSEAWNDAFQPFNQQVNDAVLGSITAGNQEQQQLFNLGLAANNQGFGQAATRAGFNNQAVGQDFGQNLTEAQFKNQAQQQAFQQAYNNAQLNNATAQQQLSQNITTRTQPLNEYNAFATGAQVSAPGYQSAQPIAMQGTPVGQYINDAYNAQLGAYNSQVGSQNSAMGGLMGLGGSALMAGATYF